MITMGGVIGSGGDGGCGHSRHSPLDHFRSLSLVLCIGGNLCIPVMPGRSAAPSPPPFATRGGRGKKKVMTANDI